MLRLYFLLDNNTMFLLGLIVTYTFLNYKVQAEFAIGAIVVFPFLMTTLVGNFRVCIVYCDWKRWQVIVYKLIKLFGSIFFLGYGAYFITSVNDN